MSRELTNLAVQAIVTLLVWRYYRTRSYPASEKYSTFGPRFWTGSVDACVIWPATFLISLVLARELSPTASTVLLFLQQTIWMAYAVAMHTKFGQTYGKMVCKVRVVDFKTERAISFRQALLREGIPIAVSCSVIIYQVFLLKADAQERLQITKSGAFWLLAILPLLWFLAEVATMLTNEKRRALHDFIAGTVVVRINVPS